MEKGAENSAGMIAFVGRQAHLEEALSVTVLAPVVYVNAAERVGNPPEPLSVVAWRGG